MTIYIYGTKSFKNSIHELLDHANIKFRLQDGDTIKDVKSLTELKQAVEDNPKNIFLIDDDKIIKKNALNNKIKFLKPKDGIEEEFLKEHGIGDMSVDSIEDIPAQIIKKIESNHRDIEEYGINSLDHYADIQNSIISCSEDGICENSEEVPDVIEEASQESCSHAHQEEDEEDGSVEEDDGSFDIDEVLALISDEEEEPSDEIEENSSIMSFDDIVNHDFGLTVEQIEEKGAENMSDEFSELDSLSEDELMAALSDIKPNDKAATNVSKPESKTSNEVELNSSGVNDIASLITQLLNNKTLEITIKIKE